ncbi:MAG: dipicolinate synthase subunit B [Clostridia bacterium]|nr:dipicolinate synthase subunit B [Clostridia bacterium]
MCGSYCTHKYALEQLKLLSESGHDILPVVSENVYSTDTRFGAASELIRKIEDICNKRVIHTIVDAEPIGPQIQLDAMIICPCTGNTLSKIANGITDTSVTMAAKAHLRSNRPLVIALASNDALSANLKNIGQMLIRKFVYFVPLYQDDPQKKPHSLIADFSLVFPTMESAILGKQYQKIFI